MIVFSPGDAYGHSMSGHCAVLMYIPSERFAPPLDPDARCAVGARSAHNYMPVWGYQVSIHLVIPPSSERDPQCLPFQPSGPLSGCSLVLPSWISLDPYKFSDCSNRKVFKPTPPPLQLEATYFSHDKTRCRGCRPCLDTAKDIQRSSRKFRAT